VSAITVVHYPLFLNPSPYLATDKNHSNKQTHTHTDRVDSTRKELHNNKALRTIPMDLAEEVNGMYRLLDLVDESGSNGCGNEQFQDALPAG
jgi:hypothetical protein